MIISLGCIMINNRKLHHSKPYNQFLLASTRQESIPGKSERRMSPDGTIAQALRPRFPQGGGKRSLCTLRPVQPAAAASSGSPRPPPPPSRWSQRAADRHAAALRGAFSLGPLPGSGGRCCAAPLRRCRSAPRQGRSPPRRPFRPRAWPPQGARRRPRRRTRCARRWTAGRRSLPWAPGARTGAARWAGGSRS